MEKKILLLVLNFLFLFSVSAQNNQGTSTNEDAERKNFFLGVGIKGNVFLNENGKDFEVWKKPTFGGNVFVGKWFNQYLAARIVLEAGKVTPYFQKMTIKEEENYFLGRVDVMFDLTNLLRPYSPDNFYNLIPYAGIGGAQAFNVKNSVKSNAENASSFLFGGGLLNTFRLSDKFSAFLNLSLDLVNAGFDESKSEKSLNGISAASIGVVYNF